VNNCQQVSRAELLGDRGPTGKKGKGICSWEQLTADILGSWYHLWERCSPLQHTEQTLKGLKKNISGCTAEKQKCSEPGSGSRTWLNRQEEDMP